MGTPHGGKSPAITSRAKQLPVRKSCLLMLAAGMRRGAAPHRRGPLTGSLEQRGHAQEQPVKKRGRLPSAWSFKKALTMSRTASASVLQLRRGSEGGSASRDAAVSSPKPQAGFVRLQKCNAAAWPNSAEECINAAGGHPGHCQAARLPYLQQRVPGPTSRLALLIASRA